jgi:hypothetical protein
MLMLNVEQASSCQSRRLRCTDLTTRRAEAALAREINEVSAPAISTNKTGETVLIRSATKSFLNVPDSRLSDIDRKSALNQRNRTRPMLTEDYLEDAFTGHQRIMRPNTLKMSRIFLRSN